MNSADTSIETSLSLVRQRIRKAEREALREPHDVTLIAVSKTRPAADLARAYATGQRQFGENYVNELSDKVAALQDLDIEWHFIGALQSNKSRAVAEQAHWLHTLDRAKLAQRLHDQRPSEMAPLHVCIQINLDAQPSKAGLAPDDLDGIAALARSIADLSRLRLRGLMAIPAPQTNTAAQGTSLRRLKALQHTLLPEFPSLDTLSMGMSDDLEAAVLEGSTMVRIGSAIFGRRAPKT